MAGPENMSGSLPVNHHKIPHHHHQIRRHRVPSGGEEQEEEELDPRIQIELEKLNRASEEINRFELELDDARAAFRQVLSDSTQRLNGLAKKVGTCVDKARPYYDARMKLKEAHLESQKAALRFERACSMHEAAKEMVQLAEEGYKRRELDLDPTWQEMLNHATMKVNDAERERHESEDFHQRTTLNFKRKEEEVQKLQKDLKRAITKSRPYFEMKAKFNQVMEDHKRAVSRLEEDVSSTKALYSQALRSLEAISDDIHRQRLERRQKLQLGVRGAGVGAEAPSPPPYWEKGSNIEGSASYPVFDSDAEDESPSNVSRGPRSISETVLDVNQLKLNRSRGIVCYEPAYRKKASLTDAVIQDGNFKTDPLDVVVFKSDLYSRSRCSQDVQSGASTSLRHQPSKQSPQDIHGWPRRTVAEDPEYGDNAVTPTPENILESPVGVVSSQSGELSNRGLGLAGTPGLDSPLSESPRRRDMELNQSSLSRAQEWVNKSPIPQQRRFVKSKSLIDASSPSLSISSPTDSELSSSLKTDVMKNAIKVEAGENLFPVKLVTNSQQINSINHNKIVAETALRKHSDLPVRTVQEQQILNSGTPSFVFSQHSYGPAEGEKHLSPSQGSPSTSRKSPKLQGLILRVDATGISPSQPAQVTVSPGVQAGHTPKVVISTQHPTLGIFTEKPPEPHSSASAEMPPPSSLPPSVKPPTSLIAQHLNKMMSVTKVSHYDSKTAPSTLSTSYHLSTSSPLKSPHGQHPSSPTKIPLSPIPPHSTTASLRHQLTSPTPSSPSADRYSISGRSDSMTSGSHKSAFLKPPSDSSDTESIASTGPMLDDDQIELINMDFTEQSIAVEAPDDTEYSLIHADPGIISRGHWSRMSLPPRLSYLEGFLERARLYLGDRKGQNLDSEDKSSCDVGSKNGSGSARSSVAASGDLEDNAGDFKDEDHDNEERNDSDNNNADLSTGNRVDFKDKHHDNDERNDGGNSVDVSTDNRISLALNNKSGSGCEDAANCNSADIAVKVETLVGDNHHNGTHINISDESTVVVEASQPIVISSPCLEATDA